MVPNYGNSFNANSQEYEAGKVPIWLFDDEHFPSGCTFNKQTAGTTIKAGTAVYVAKPGAEAVILTGDYADSTATDEATGLLLEDVHIGTAGATGTVVTKGQVLVDRIPELTDAVKSAIKNRITLVSES